MIGYHREGIIRPLQIAVPCLYMDGLSNDEIPDILYLDVTRTADWKQSGKQSGSISFLQSKLFRPGMKNIITKV